MVLNPTWTGIWTLAAAVAAVTAVESTLKTYTVLAPCSVRPFSEYQVVVTLEGTDQDTTVQLKLTAPGEDGVNRTVEEDVVVPPNQSRTALLQVPALGVGKVTLSARGQGGLDFYNSTEVQLEWRNASVLIQTDKAKYKPGQTVRLRVLTLDAGLKPTVRGPLHVHVTDARGNRIKQWLTTTPPSGLWSASLPLSEQTLLGEWTVEAKLLSRQGVPVGSAKKSFTVAEYVLPTFEVTANAPKVTSFSQPKIGVTITAKYTFGKPVEGRVTVRANLPYYYIFDHPFHHGLPPVPVLAGSVEPADGNATSTSTTTSTTTTTTTTTTSTTAPPPFVTPEKRPKFVEKVVPIDGITTVEFDVIQDLKMDQQQHYNSVDFQVSVEEGLTGRRQNATEIHTEVRALDYDVQFVDSPHDFTPGKPVIVKVKVTNLEDAPIQDNDNPVTLSIMGHFTEKEQTRVLKEEKIPASGIVSFQIDTNDNQTSYSLEAKYRNKTAFHYLSTFTPYSSSSELTLHVETNSIKVGDDVVVRVHTKSQVRQLTMLVIAPLGIKEARSEPVLDVNGTTLHFKATSDLAPASRLLVHALLKNGTIVTDVCAFKVDDPLPVVGVRVAPGRSQPGQDVRLEVSAQPNATVALLAVDQSVLLLQDSATNDIAADELRRERLSFEARERTPWGGARSDSESLAEHRRWRGYYDSEEESFKDAGLVFLSNAKVFQREYPKFEAVAFAGAPVAFGAVAANSGGMRPPGAFGAPIPPVGLAGTGSVAPRLRTRFPETWLWESVDSGADGNVTLMRTVPDTITSWFVTALAVDPVNGVGLGAPAKLTVFRPFFVSLNLPYAVIRGETVQVPVSVFNYLDDEVTATVTLDNQRGDFEFASNTTGGRARRAEAAGTARSVQVKVPAQGSASAAFSITPTKVGHALLRVTATSDKAGDAVERPLKVKAEGDTQYRNKAIMVDLRKDMKLKTKVELEMPNNIVPDSENVEVSAIADVLGPTTANLDSLIRIPYGCGEQNMLNFVPNIVVIKYLNRTRQAHPELVRKARSYTEMGYQRELTYRHKDGSFSAFGESDKNGSTWLTAFVAKSFRMATSLVDVEDRIVNEALQWLAKQQADNGSFPEVGTVSHRDMQGGSAKGLALTAYVLIAFMQGQDATFEHQATVKKSLEYLVSNMDSLDDPYAIAIAAYALHVANHPAKDKAFTLLESKAEDSGQHRWWNKTVEGDKDNPHWGQPNSVNVEMTSYALLTYLERGLIEKAVPVMQWLVSQRNSNGGFASTQDTVVGLQALAAMAERVSLAGGDMRIVFAHGASPADAKKEESIVVNSKTGSVLQKHELPRNTRLVEVSAEGTGFALAQVSWSYNEDTAEKHPLFNLRVHVDNATQPNLLSLRVCSSFVAGRWGTESNMAVMEVTLPSGFAADLDSLGALKADPNVRRVETKDQDGIIVLYFDKMETKDYCVDVSAVRAFSVSNQKPVPITVYDYYDQSRRARKFYEAPKVETADKAH